MIRVLVTILLALVMLNCSAQNSVVGKWKPIIMNVDNYLKADVKADTVIITDSIDAVLKDDEDPKASKDLLKMMAKMFFDKMKVTQEEFAADGTFIETNIATGRKKTAKYSYDNKTRILKRQTAFPGMVSEDFIVSFQGTNMLLEGEMENFKGQKGKVSVLYEKQ